MILFNMVTQLTISERDLLTTGEAAVLLHVSRSTVSRLFDRGKLSGEANPITGERRISRHSILELLRKHGRTGQGTAVPLTKRILVATSHNALAGQMRRIADIPPQLAMTYTPFGADALIACSRSCPDLLVMDGHLNDIDCANMIAALKRQDVTRALKILCFQDPPSTADGADTIYIPGIDRMDDKDIREHLNRILNLTDAVAASEPHGRRRWKRHPVSIPTRIGIYPSRSPRQRYWGKAVIENISRGGAFLNEIEMDEGMLTAAPFRMVVQSDHHPLENWQANCQITRLCSNEHVSAGVQFLRLPEENRNQLLRLCG